MSRPSGIPENSWDRSRWCYTTSLENPGINDVYHRLYPPMIELIDRLVRLGFRERYDACTSHERLFIFHPEHLSLSHVPRLCVIPREDGRLDCRFCRAKMRSGRPSAEALGLDIAAAVEAVTAMARLLDQYRDEVPPQSIFDVPDEWFLSESDKLEKG